jgi:VanZ family protein
MNKIFDFATQNNRRAVILATIWTALILLACFIPSSQLPKANIPLIDKWVHVVIFCGLSFLWLCVFPKANVIIGILIFTMCCLVGYAVELIQGSGLVSGRSYETNDVIADAIGAGLGVMAFFLFRKAVQKPRKLQK